MESLIPLIINLVSGAVGGNVAGSLLKKLSLGSLGNSIVGILGGGIGSQVMNMLGSSGGGAGTLDIVNIVTSIASGGIGGGVLMAIVGFIKQMISK